MYVVIEQLFEDLNSYCESFVALPEAPHTKYVNEALKGAIQTGKRTSFSTKATPGSPSISGKGPEKTDHEEVGNGSFTVGRDSLIEALEHYNDVPPLTIGDPTMLIEGRPTARRSSSDTHSLNGLLSSSVQSSDSRESKSIASRKDSSGSITISPTARPSMGRSKTLAALGVSETTVNAVPGTIGLVPAEKEKEAGDSIDTVRRGAAPTLNRATSTESATTVTGDAGQPSSFGDDNGEESIGLDESIMSLRTIGATEVNNSISPKQRKTSGGDTQVGTSVGAVAPAAMLAPGKREPPHGLGRTVRDAINLKLFPTYPNPKDINDWDVPVTLLDLRKRVTGNWDLTMCKVLPFVDGINHVKRIAQLADADLELTRQCIEHLLYYRCIITIDTFQFTNMYTVRPSIAVMAEDEVIISECATYVTKPGHILPPWPKLLGLYSSLRPAVTVNEWIEENDVEVLGIDVRRFVSFGVIKGFLRRVHRYPILLQSDPSPTFRGSIRRGTSSPGGGERDPSNSRSRERVTRVKEEDLTYTSNPHSSMSPDDTMKEAFAQRAGRHGPRQISENDSIRGTQASVTSSGGGRRRAMDQGALRKTRATVMDVANVALEAAAAAKEQENQTSQQTQPRVSIRTPLPRGGSSATLRATAMAGSRDSDEASNYVTGGSSYGINPRTTRHGIVKIPPGFIELLDGTHPDDEFCVRFGMSWNDVLAVLVVIGKQPGGHSNRQSAGRSSRTGEQDEDGGAAAQSGWASTAGGGVAGGGEGDESAFANISGFYGPGLASGQRKSVGGTLPKYRRTSQQTIQGVAAPGQSGFSRYASTGDGASGWGRYSGIQGSSLSHDDHHQQLDQESMARGDLGKVKIIVK